MLLGWRVCLPSSPSQRAGRDRAAWVQAFTLRGKMESLNIPNGTQCHGAFPQQGVMPLESSPHPMGVPGRALSKAQHSMLAVLRTEHLLQLLQGKWKPAMGHQLPRARAPPDANCPSSA